jgi:hypothetical protein
MNYEISDLYEILWFIYCRYTSFLYTKTKRKTWHYITPFSFTEDQIPLLIKQERLNILKCTDTNSVFCQACTTQETEFLDHFHI